MEHKNEGLETQDAAWSLKATGWILNMMLLYKNEIPVPVHVAPLVLVLALLPPLPQLPPAHLSPVSPEAAQPLPSPAEELGHK